MNGAASPGGRLESAPDRRRHMPWGRLIVAGLVAVLSLTAATPAAAAQRGQDKDCSLTSVGLVPLTDLGAETYLGAQGGLYPQGSNEVPAAHLAVGLERAATIVPRDAAGNPDPNGAIVFVSIGFSNTMREFGEFLRIVPATSDIAPSIVVVNGAQGGQHILEWSNPRGRPWRGLTEELAAAGVTPEQVQGAWIKLTQRIEASGYDGFPASALEYRTEFVKVVQMLQEALPNLQVGYVTSRVYGGYNAVSSPSPEPMAYEEGFGVKWAIEGQIAGNPALNADPDAGPVVAPWLAWGPYIWADGTTPRSDGLTWSCRELRADGAHLETEGNRKVATMLMHFLEAEPTAAWMFSDRELPAPPTDLGEPIPTSTIPGDTTTPTTEPPPDDDTTTTSTVGATTTTTTGPPSTTTNPPPDAGPAPQSEDTVPAVVWALLGAGTALLFGALGAFLLQRRRPNRRQS